MALVKFDPMRNFESLVRRVNSLSHDFEKGFNLEFGNFSPRIDISEDEKGIFIQAEIPGLTKDDVKVTINDDNVLMIKGEKKRIQKSEDEKDNVSFIRLERSFGEFCRSFMLNDNIKKDSIKAKFDNGVLSLSLEKIEPEPPKEIPISIE